MNTIETAYGSLVVSERIEYYADGAVRSCSAVAETVLSTRAGNCVPQYTTDDVRKKTVQAIALHQNGVPKSLPLETSTLVNTPAGALSAELLTFYPNGAVHRVFPLNGKLSGYWSQEDEAKLAEPLCLHTPAGVITAKCISVCFYASGALKSLTLWPEESVPLSTPAGTLQVRMGISFNPDGGIDSVEPALPQRVQTPVGEIQAFNPDAVGIHGDTNSLAFSPQGEIRHVLTTLTRIVVNAGSEAARVFAPQTRASLCGNEASEPVPLEIAFSKDSVAIRPAPDAPMEEISLTQNTVNTQPHTEFMTRPFGESRCSL